MPEAGSAIVNKTPILIKGKINSQPLSFPYFSGVFVSYFSKQFGEDSRTAKANTQKTPHVAAFGVKTKFTAPFYPSLFGVFFFFFFSQNSLVKIPELQANMFQLATEMEKAGLVEEVVSDGLALTDVRPPQIFFVHPFLRAVLHATSCSLNSLRYVIKKTFPH